MCQKKPNTFSINMNLNSLYFVIFSINAYIIRANASAGDRSYYYRKCTQNCFDSYCNVQNNRELDSKKRSFELNQSVYLKYLGWDCFDECKYECMWQTVDYFTETEKRDVPQFYGKWPFVRIYGNYKTNRLYLFT